jgi:hypothetical protein
MEVGYIFLAMLGITATSLTVALIVDRGDEYE